MSEIKNDYMKITLLGTASGVPVKDRKSSAVLIERRGMAVLFDAGEGVTSTLQTLGKHVDSIQRIYISHTHPDHISGLPMLLQWMHLGGRKAPLHIVCDQRLHVWLLSMLRGMFLVPVDWDFELHIVNLSYTAFGDEFGAEITAIENAHLALTRAKTHDYGVPAVCYSFMVRSGARLLFLSSDVGSIEDVVPHIGLADAVVVECTHIPFDDLLAAMKRTPEPAFVLTHIPPELEPDLNRFRNILQSEIGERATFASDGYSFTLPDGRPHG